MPKKKPIVRDQQVYKLPLWGATVTIDYDIANPPPFFQPAPNTAVIGDHQCAPIVMHDPNYGIGIDPGFDARQHSAVPRGGNFEVNEDDPAYQAFKASGGRGLPPAPPGASPKVLTSEDLF